MAEAREAALPAALGPVGGADRGVTAERTLIRAAQAGSATAMEERFRRHWPRAHRAAWLVVLCVGVAAHGAPLGPSRAARACGRPLRGEGGTTRYRPQTAVTRRGPGGFSDRAARGRRHGVVSHRQLATAGYRTLRFTDRQLENDPRTVAATVRAQLNAG